MGLRLNLDPTAARVLAIAICLTIKDIFIGLLFYTKQGQIPEPVEIYTIVLSAGLTLVIYVLAFLQTGEMPTEG